MSVTILILVLLVGAVVFVAAATRRLQNQALTGQMFRRGFQYVLLYALILVVVNGAADLLGRLLAPQMAANDEYQLAQSLTAIVIAAPIGAVLTWWVARTHRNNPSERDSLLYQSFLTAGALTGAALTASALQQVLTTAIGSAALNTQALAELVVWTIVWAGHWQLIARTLVPVNTVAHLLLGSALGLVLATGGLIDLLANALTLFTGPPLLVGAHVGLGAAAGMFVSGAIIWVVYWLVSASRMPRGVAWHAFVLLLGVAGGLVTGLVGAQGLLWYGLVQMVGRPRLFGSWLEWPEAVAALVIGATVWWYHRAILGPTPHTSVRRIYFYLVSGISVLATAAGIGLLVVALIDAIAPASLFHHPMNTLLGALTLLVIGAGVWWLHWRTIQQRAQDDPETELATASRRIYLVILLGGSGVVVVIALIAAVVDVVHDIMQGQLSLATLYTIRTELGFIAASTALIAYHGAILRQDQSQGPVTAPLRRGTLTLIGPSDPGLVAVVAEHIDGPVRLLAIELATTWDTDAILAALDTYEPEDDLVIIARDGGIEAHPAEALRYLQ